MYEQYDKAVQIVLNYLNDQGFSRTPLKYFRQASRNFREYLEKHQLEYSGDSAQIWLEVLKQTTFKWKFLTSRRAMALIDDVVQNNTVTRLVFSYNKNTLKHRVPEGYKPLLNEYIKERMEEGKQPSTLQMDVAACTRFLLFLQAQGINNVKFITPELIKDYHTQAEHRTVGGRNAYTYRIRNFIRFLARKKLVPETFEFAFSTEKAPKVSIVTTLSKKQVDRIKNYYRLGSTPYELRSAAISILTLRMGFRSTDICNLRISDISWKNRTISIVQQKTGVPLTLPFPVDVGNILFRYITEGRPICTIPKVFTSLNHPYRGIDKSQCYRSSVAILGTKRFPEDSRGMHILRRTFASKLLAAGNTVSIISAALGHINEKTVDTYLSTDEQRMRLCSIGLTGIEIQEARI